MAAEQGLAVAQDNCASALWNGDGVEKNLAESVRWRRMAAEQGDAYAQRRLADAYISRKASIET